MEMRNQIFRQQNIQEYLIVLENVPPLDVNVTLTDLIGQMQTEQTGQ
jgi:hypothetical protein